MKNLLKYALAAFVLFGLAFTQVSYAQDDPTAGKQNRGQVKPNFVDEDGDGICDNNTGEPGTGTGSMHRGGQGKGQGAGNGQGIHQRLRDGSCGETPIQDGSGATNNSQATKGRKRGNAPSK
ncbi:MAG: hypothetical protein CL946_07565 [Ectothiorhodospiraceae bacterium]|nr:hypothetical protein [Ectothiorhodospiraceae bacterium]